MTIRNLFPELWRGERLWNPVRDMSRLQRNIDRMFDQFLTEPFGGFNRSMEEEFVPACDVEESNTHYLITFDLPGMKKDEVKIELLDNQLIISGERKKENKQEEKGRMSQERYYGAFSRSFSLPTKVDPDKVEANYENGVLQIAILKTPMALGKQIPIKEGKRIEVRSSKAA